MARIAGALGGAGEQKVCDATRLDWDDVRRSEE